MVNKRAVLVVSLIALLGASGLYGLYATPSADKTAYATSTASTSPAGARGEPGGAHGAGITVQTAIVENRDFPVVLHTFGHVQAPQTVAVAARTASQITAIHVKDGQMVRAGDLLFSLDDRQAKADLARDQAILAKDNALLAAANTGLERARTLRDENTGTQQAYETALSVQKSTEATIAADQATIDADQVALSLLQIHAPIDGRLGTVQVAIGDLVGQSGTASTSLVTITAVDPIDVDFTLPEERLQTFKQLLDSGARPQVVAKVSGTDTVIGQGTLDFIDSAVDTASGTIRMRATFENGAQKLWPGQYVDVDVEEETLAQVPVVPTVAVQFGQSGPYVYRLKDDDTVEVRPIAVAADDGTSSAITAGLSSGDRIVIEGQSRLKPGERVSVASAAPATG